MAGRQRIEDLHLTATRAGWRHPRDEYAGALTDAQREEEELRHCSFKPQLVTAAHTREAPSGGGYPEEDIARRCERWVSRRETLLRHERGVQAAKELEDCTFTPNVDLPDSSTRAAQAGHRPTLALYFPCTPLHPLHALAPPRNPSYPLASLAGGPRARHYLMGRRRHRGAPGAAEWRTRDARRARPAQ